MHDEEFGDIINQLEEEFQEVAAAEGSAESSRDSVDAEQMDDLSRIGNFVNAIYDDIQNLSSTSTIELKITQQPKGSFSFRFKSHTKSVYGGNLNGRQTGTEIGRVGKSYPRVELQNTNVSTRYFVRCTLHQAPDAAETKSFLSPHLLYRRDAKTIKYAEMEMFPCIREETLHSFTLENFTIVKTARKDWHRVLRHKLQELQWQDKNLDFVRIVNEQLHKPQDKVRLCFEAFEYTDLGYLQVAGPIYSESISNGAPPRIELCNKSAAINELIMVTLKVNSVKPKDIIHIFHADDQDSNDDDDDDDAVGNNVDCDFPDWATTVIVEKEMIHEQSAITFRMPNYRGGKDNNGKDRIKCSIQLERASDGARSNKATFYFIDTKKRRRRHRRDSKIAFKKIRRFNSDESSTHFQSIEKKSELLLKELYRFYEMSRNMDYKDREKFAEDVRRYYKVYEQTNAEGNSFLHEIILDADHRVYDIDIDLIMIIRHFKLNELINESINIYGETALMLACMENRPLLMKALIDMGSCITVQNVECGNNVLHIAMQQQSDEGRKVLMKSLISYEQTMALSFITALGSYNMRGMTPLHLAVLQNNVTIVTELLQFCRRQNAFEVCQMGQLTDGNTILHLAVLNRLTSMQSCILEYSDDDSFKYFINFADYTAEELERH